MRGRRDRKQSTAGIKESSVFRAVSLGRLDAAKVLYTVLSAPLPAPADNPVGVGAKSKLRC